MPEVLNSVEELAEKLLDQLTRGGPVVLEVSARDPEMGGLLRLITALHTLAQARKIGVKLEPVGLAAIRLTLA